MYKLLLVYEREKVNEKEFDEPVHLIFSLDAEKVKGCNYFMVKHDGISLISETTEHQKNNIV